MTTLEKHTRRNQLLIRIAELEDQIQERKAETAAKIEKASETLLKLNEKHNKKFEELLKKEKELKSILAEYEKDRRYVDAGQMVFQEMKDEIRRLSCQVEGQDLNLDLLNMQLSAFGVEDLKYLHMLANNLRKRRGLIFKTGRIDPDELSDKDGKRGYELGKKIGSSTIPVH